MQIEPQPNRFKKGDRVRINEGAFKNFVGVVEKVDNPNDQVCVVIQVYGHAAPVELDQRQLDPMIPSFQFSMRAMFGATAWFCLTAWLVAMFWRNMSSGEWQTLLYFSAPAAAGAGMGTLSGEPLRYAVWAIVLAFLVGMAATILRH
jgi:KOW motif